MDAAEFGRQTGWDIKPEGACKGDACVPLPGGFDLAGAADRLGMALVRDDEHDLWALGPEAVGGRALVTRGRPRARPPRPRWQRVPPLVAAGPEGRARRLGALLRLPLRPARVAGTARRAPSARRRGRHGLARAERAGGVSTVHRGGAADAPLAAGPDAPDGRPVRRREHPERHLDRRGGHDRPPAPSPAGRARPCCRPRCASASPSGCARRREEAARTGQEPFDLMALLRTGQDRDAYPDAIRDWASNGAASPFALTPDEVVAASQPRARRGVGGRRPLRAGQPPLADR